MKGAEMTPTTRQRMAGIATAVSIVAAAAPTAAARPAEQFLDLPSAHTSAGAAEVRTVDDPPQPGFDWGDAEIGAGAGITLGVLAAGGAFLVAGRRRVRLGRSAA
jgi:hypothetical protein